MYNLNFNSTSHANPALLSDPFSRICLFLTFLFFLLAVFSSLFLHIVLSKSKLDHNRADQITLVRWDIAYIFTAVLMNAAPLIYGHVPSMFFCNSTAMISMSLAVCGFSCQPMQARDRYNILYTLQHQQHRPLASNTLLKCILWPSVFLYHALPILTSGTTGAFGPGLSASSRVAKEFSATTSSLSYSSPSTTSATISSSPTRSNPTNLSKLCSPTTHPPMTPAQIKSAKLERNAMHSSIAQAAVFLGTWGLYTVFFACLAFDVNLPPAFFNAANLFPAIGLVCNPFVHVHFDESLKRQVRAYLPATRERRTFGSRSFGVGSVAPGAPGSKSRAESHVSSRFETRASVIESSVESASLSTSSTGGGASWKLKAERRQDHEARAAITNALFRPPVAQTTPADEAAFKRAEELIEAIDPLMEAIPSDSMVALERFFPDHRHVYGASKRLSRVNAADSLTHDLKPTLKATVTVRAPLEEVATFMFDFKSAYHVNRAERSSNVRERRLVCATARSHTAYYRYRPPPPPHTHTHSLTPLTTGIESQVVSETATSSSGLQWAAPESTGASSPPPSLRPTKTLPRKTTASGRQRRGFS